MNKGFFVCRRERASFSSPPARIVQQDAEHKAEKAKCRMLLPDNVPFICEANGHDAEKIGQHCFEILPEICVSYSPQGMGTPANSK